MSTKNISLTTAIIKRTHRVPKNYLVQDTTIKNVASEAIARQLDVALVSNGFKASGELLLYISGLEAVYAKEISKETVNAVRELIGSHVKHNTYFKNFPENVPDTIEFWAELIEKTYGDNVAPLFVNLLELDGYGEYQHTYEEMVEYHDTLIPSLKNKARVLNLGEDLQTESHKLFLSLAESSVVSNEEDKKLLEELTLVNLTTEQPDKIPVRENRAIINSVRLGCGQPLLADTVTDILRLAVHMSDGDVSLQEKAKFRSFTRQERRSIMSNLERIVSENSSKLGDVFKNREAYKRLAEKIHPFEFKNQLNAQKVFRIAQDAKNLSFESKVEKAFLDNDIVEAVRLLSNAPGMFVKNFNRVLLSANIRQLGDITDAFEKVLPKVTTPTLLGLRQYLNNRAQNHTSRLFINKKGTGKVVADEQPVLTSQFTAPISEMIDKEVTSRLKEGTYIINRDVLGVALPLSNKSTNSGLGVMPRGSKTNINTEVVRLFTYWKEKNSTTDFDLSAVMLDEKFNNLGQLSYTNLRLDGHVHSGDITSARNGASEFIDIVVPQLDSKYVIPQVNVYSGEGFEEVEESFFGFMERDKAGKNGLPFEPTTVNTKGDMRGKNRVSLPLVLIKEDDGSVTVKWLNMFIAGRSLGNATENNTVTSIALVRSMVETEYLDVAYIVDLLKNKENATVIFEDEVDKNGKLGEDYKVSGPLTYIGLHESDRFTPEEETRVITLLNLHELI